MEKTNFIKKWFEDNGDNTHSINHELTENSIVIDLGGYYGVWADKIFAKYNCNLYLVEPINEFYNFLIEKYKNNKKFSIIDVGVSNIDIEKEMFKNDNGSSIYLKSDTIEKVKFLTFNNILDKFDLLNKDIDLLQINIEGEEYNLLYYLIENQLIKKIKKIQVQYHIIDDYSEEKRNLISKKLKENGFVLEWEYPWVWEAWKQI